METKIGMLSNVLKSHKGIWLTGKELSNLIKKNFNTDLTSKVIHKLIKELLEVGYVIQIKIAAHNTRIYSFEGIII